MVEKTPRIDPYLFEQQFEAFRIYVEEQVGVPFVSFASHPYTEEHEGYKYVIYGSAHKALSFHKWTKSDIGSGKLISSIIKSIEIPQNNLVPWQSRFGKEARPQQPLYEALNNSSQCKLIETVFFKVYHESKEAESINELITIFGRTYPLLAYFFFIKDRSKYLPIAPRFFDNAFELLGADFNTSHRCSWENYSTYLSLIGELKTMLSNTLSPEVSLLDAHSFAWILSSQMVKNNKLADVQKYLSQSRTEREAIIKARVGQGQFRENLINYWTVCAVTGCKELQVLRASHIKPWSKSNLSERLSLYNGLLLSPALDVCFDSGFISFDDKGSLLISSQLSGEDQTALGIHEFMKLAKVEPGHMKFLAYHRENIFK